MAVRKRSKINYLSNIELLHEINESKKTFSYFVDDAYSDYSVIVEDINNITDEEIELGKIKLADDTNQKMMRKAILEGKTKSEIDEMMRSDEKFPENFTKEDLVYRQKTLDHVPQEFIDIGQKTLLNRLKFPSFKHYAYVNGELKEVGRSHWEGGLDNGHFSTEHGKVTDTLCKSLMLMVDRYGTKPNFSGYTYLDEMKGQALLQLSIVSIQFDEAKSNNPFAWYTTTIHTSFLKVLKSEKKQRNIRDEFLQQEAGYSSFAYADEKK